MPEPANTSPSTAVAPATRPASTMWAFAATVASYVLLLAVLGGLTVGYEPLRARAATMQAAAPTVRFQWPPLAGTSAAVASSSEPRTWINREIRHELEDLVLRNLSPDPFDRAGLDAARSALIGTGWLRDDVRLDRTPNGQTHVRGTWRIPAAAVRQDGHDMLVTSSGELLPVKYKPGASGFKVIVGVTTPPPTPGEPWLGNEVQTGIKLLEYLGSLPSFHQVSGIDISQYSADRSLVIVTDTGNRILWGGSPETFTPGEPDAYIKLARLNQLFREFGRLDANRPLVDVRLLNGVYIHDTAKLTSAQKSPSRDRLQVRR